MNLLCDEGVDRQIVERLRKDGHQVLYVLEMQPGISDDVVLAQAVKDSALLVTADKDFGELVFRQRLASAGVLLVRLHGFSPEHKATLVSTVIHQRESQLISAFAVISSTGVRIRSTF